MACTLDICASFQSTLPMRGATKIDRSHIKDALFQSTLPMRGATCVQRTGLRSTGFQSTLPMRGATCLSGLYQSAITISIHTPHAGSDPYSKYAYRRPPNFNPHSPCGERRPGSERDTFAPDFNPHSPCGERLAHVRLVSHGVGISIHTPHAGSDTSGSSLSAIETDFNPHSPCGERRRSCSRCNRPWRFQSTLPMRGATRV